MKPRHQQATQGLARINLLCVVFPSLNHLLGDNAGQALWSVRLLENNPANT